MGKDSLLNEQCWEHCGDICKRMKLALSLTQYTNINSKCIKDLNARPETVKLLDENTGSELFARGLGNDFLDLTPNAMATKAKIDKLDYIRLIVCAQQR